MIANAMVAAGRGAIVAADALVGHAAETGTTKTLPEAVVSNSEQHERPLSALAGFDIASGLQRMGGDQQLYRRLLLDFGVCHQDDVAAIKAAMAAADWDRAHALVHALKGLTGNLSAMKVYNVAIELEAVVRAEPRDQRAISAWMLALQQALAQAVEQVAQLRTDDEPQVAGGDDADLDAGLEPDAAAGFAVSLREAAGIGDLDRLTHLAGELPIGSALAARFQKLLDEFDFDGLEKLAAELAPR